MSKKHDETTRSNDSAGHEQRLPAGKADDVRFHGTMKTTKEGVTYDDSSMEEQKRKGFDKSS